MVRKAESLWEGFDRPLLTPALSSPSEGEERETAPNTEHRTLNIEHRTSNIEHRTSNIEHRTSNIER
jgi:hypothetical protein